MAASVFAELRKTAKGMGVFALKHFAKGEMMLKLRGHTIPKPNKFTVQISESEHLDIEGTVPSYLNHSCDPNGYIDYSSTPISLRASRNVKQDEELNFNYATTEWEMSNPFDCQCGADNCSRDVRGLKFLALEQQQKLLPQLSPAMRKLVLQRSEV